MAKLGDTVQSADWKSEKHSPVIECPDSAAAGEKFEVKVSVGKEIAHPNTTEHHIRWIQVYFKPDDEKFTYQLANAEFSAHGESAKGANEGPAYTEPAAAATVSLKQSGTIHALSFCNIHGLWESSKAVKIG